MSDDKNYRDAKTGEWVTKEYAEENPDTTVSETVDDGYEENDVFTQPVETIELSDQDVADLEALGVSPVDGGPNFHTVLEVWREVLKPAADEGQKRPTPQWCNRMIGSYTGVTFADMYVLRDSYFSKIQELLDILLEEIKTDSDALSYDKPEDDAVENAGHYRKLLLDWQVQFLKWELDWDCTNPDAAVEIAAIAEVHKLFFGPTGLTQFLDNIRFEYTEADQAELAEALNQVKEESGE